MFKNTLAQSSSTFASYIASLVLAPVMLSRLGLEAFGVWAVTGALVTYARALDFGVGRSLSRFVALYDSSGDRRGVQECLGLGLLVVSALAVLALGAAWLTGPLAVDALDAPLTDSEMRTVLLSSVVVGVSYAYTQVLNAVPIGMLRMVPPNVANTVAILINLVFSLVALALSDDLADYALANAAAGIVGLLPIVVGLAIVWRRPYASIPSWARTREIVSYGIKGQVNWIADLINMETDKLVIAVMLGVEVAGIYEIGSRVAIAIRSFGVLTLSAMIPTATAEIASGGSEVIPPFYRRYLRLSVGLSFGLFAAGCAVAPFLLVAWLGEVPGEATSVLILLMVGYAANVTTGVGTSLAMAEGKPGLVAIYSMIPAGINLVLTLAFAPLFGLWGVLAATTIAWLVGSLLFVRAYHRLHGMPWSDYLRNVLPATGLSLALASPVAIWFALGGQAPDERLPALAATAVVGVSFTVAYWLIAGRMGLLPDRLTAPWRRRAKRGAAAASS